MKIDINEENLKQGLMGLVLALVEIITETLKHQAVRRMEGGTLSKDEIERLGMALKEMGRVIEEIKMDFGVVETVKTVRDSIDDALNNLINFEECFAGIEPKRSEIKKAINTEVLCETSRA